MKSYNQLCSKKTTLMVILFLIVAVAFFIRIININNTPPGVYPDEAVNGEDALRAIDTGHYQWFYPANQGREGLFMNLIAFCFMLLGPSILALKLPSIVFGTLTVLGTYLLAKEMFQKERLALISSYLVAVSFWAINFSRISFRANMLPFVLVFSFYFLFKGLRTRKWIDFALGGIFFGIGLHTYIAFRIAPLILFLGIISFLFSYENFLKIYWKKILIFIFFFALLASPMIYTFFAHPEFFESRSSSISILSPQVNHGNLAKTALRTIGMSLIKYNFWGDQNWRHNFPPYPVLDPITGIAFLFGFIYAFIRIVLGLKKRFFQKERDPQINPYWFLLAWFFAMLVPEFMTGEGLPHALRSIGTIPPVMILSAMTIDAFWERSQLRNFFSRRLSIVLIIVMLSTVGIFNVVKYHLVWANKVETARSFNKELIEISEYIKTLPLSTEKFLVTGSMQRIPIMIFNHFDKLLKVYYPNEIDKISPLNRKTYVIILTEKNDDIISQLRTRFGDNLNFEERKDKPGLSFYLLRPVQPIDASTLENNSNQ